MAIGGWILLRLAQGRGGTTFGAGRSSGVSVTSRGVSIVSATAAAMSSRPKPKTALGTSDPGKGAQSCAAASGTAEWISASSVAATFPRRSGTADQSSATAPATWGEAAEVPEKDAV